MSTKSALLSIVFLVAFWLSCIAGMVAHIITCVATDWVAMLLVGLFIPPVGIVHGIGIILGVWG